MDDAICDGLLGLEKDSIGLMESFEGRLTTDPTTATFFSPLKRNKYKSWKENCRKERWKSERIDVSKGYSWNFSCTFVSV